MSSTRTSRRLLRDERGQMTVELLLVLPVFLLALVIVVNVGMFIAEAARFDRVVGEVARSLTTAEIDPSSAAATALDTALGYQGGAHGPFRAHVNVTAHHEVFFERRTLDFSLSFRLFATAAAPKTAGKPFFTRHKTLVIMWSRGL